MRAEGKSGTSIVGISGGPDSVYLALRLARAGLPLILAHFNHRARGPDSDFDENLVWEMAEALGISIEVGKTGARRRTAGQFPARFEEEARRARYEFLRKIKERTGAGKILVAHTADDQVETILMRVFEGAGISGLKGIPRATAEGVERPLLDTWREEILDYLHAKKIPYRIDKSNEDVRFERNWIRCVLIPLLEKRYGKSVRKRIHALGERFREIDELLEHSARTMLKNNVKFTRCEDGPGAWRDKVSLSRKSYRNRPTAVGKKALQLICFEHLGLAPNERLLESMDRVIRSGGPSARLTLGKGATLRCRYDEALLAPPPVKRMKAPTRHFRPIVLERPGRFPIPPAVGDAPSEIVLEQKAGLSASAARRMSVGERAAAFDADGLRLPLAVRPLRAGDRIRPFGVDADKKVKEVLIDRKVPRDERWGRPVVCDAAGEILWIPGVVRSARAPVASRTRRTVILRTVR